MAPPSADVDVERPVETSHPIKAKAGIHTVQHDDTGYPTLYNYSGTLDKYESFDVTKVIGREFPNAQLSELLPDDAKIRDLAILGWLTFPRVLRASFKG